MSPPVRRRRHPGEYAQAIGQRSGGNECGVDGGFVPIPRRRSFTVQLLPRSEVLRAHQRDPRWKPRRAESVTVARALGRGGFWRLP